MSDLTEATARLRAGELVAIPTETVYGLAADASNAAAVGKIFALKGRPPSRPLIVHLADAGAIDSWAQHIPDYARRWAEHFWPGPLALVLHRQPGVLDAVTGGQDTVALRVPDHPLTLELLACFGGGLAAPSANRYGRISPTTPAHVQDEFGAECPYLLDGGACRVGIESTIVSCLDEYPQILRPGRVTAAALRAIGNVDVVERVTDSPVVVPGQVHSHYAPLTPTELLAHGEPEKWPIPRSRVGFLGFHSPPFTTAAEKRLSLEPGTAATQLYSALRALDQAGVDRILIEAPPDGSEWYGVLDRLRRATA